MELADTAQIIGIVRDVLLVLLLTVMLLVVLILWRKVSSLIDSAKRTAKGAEEIVEAVSSKVVAPATAGAGVAFGMGKVAAFLTGFARKRQRDRSD